MQQFEIFSDGNNELLDRLIERHRRIIDSNLDAIKNRTILDLAANNGRWSYAAIAAGANKVISIEGREQKVNDAKKAFEKLAISDRVDLNTGDMYLWLNKNSKLKVNTVFCLGIFYHVMDHYMLLKQISNISPEAIIIDSGFVRSFRNSVHIQTENPNKHLNTLQVYEGQQKEIVGFVSLGLMIQMAWNLGYSCRPIVWDPKEINNRNCVHDYLMGRRFTLRLNRTSKFEDPNWKDKWRDALTTLDPKFVGLFDRETHDALTDDRVRRPFANTEFTIM